MSPALAWGCAALLLVAASPAAMGEPYAPPPLPLEPAAPEVAADECEERDLQPGSSPPPAAVRCVGVVVPRSVYLAAEEWVADARAARGLYQMATIQLVVERDLALAQRDEARAALQPRPWWERPGPALAVGVVAGVGLTLGAAWGWGQVAQGR